MKTTVQYERNAPNTVNGDSITINITYSSFDTAQIDALEQHFKETIGYALITEDKEQNNEKSKGIV